MLQSLRHLTDEEHDYDTYQHHLSPTHVMNVTRLNRLNYMIRNHLKTVSPAAFMPEFLPENIGEFFGLTKKKWKMRMPIRIVAYRTVLYSVACSGT